MYFLGFIAHVIDNRIDNEQSVGTNVYGPEWARTAMRLQKFGDKVIAGDFSSFDGTLNTAIMLPFVDMVNEWYDDGEENALVRRVLFQEVINSVHLCADLYYDCDHSQPSGNPVTTELNSFYNSVSMRVVFSLCAEKAGKVNQRFDDHASMVSYGDDNCVNISDQIVEWFNQNTITDAYAQIGMIYTDEAKTTGEVAPYRSIGEIQYLKRFFKQDGGDWLCPLDFDSTVERINWIRDNPSAIDLTLENCAETISEFVYHGESTFNEWVPKINRLCDEIIKDRPRQSTFADFMLYRHNEYF
jgi:hypothetical protein